MPVASRSKARLTDSHTPVFERLLFGSNYGLPMQPAVFKETTKCEVMYPANLVTILNPRILYSLQCRGFTRIAFSLPNSFTPAPCLDSSSGAYFQGPRSSLSGASTRFGRVLACKQRPAASPCLFSRIISFFIFHEHPGLSYLRNVLYMHHLSLQGSKKKRLSSGEGIR